MRRQTRSVSWMDLAPGTSNLRSELPTFGEGTPVPLYVVVHSPQFAAQQIRAGNGSSLCRCFDYPADRGVARRCKFVVRAIPPLPLRRSGYLAKRACSQAWRLRAVRLASWAFERNLAMAAIVSEMLYSCLDSGCVI